MKIVCGHSSSAGDRVRRSFLQKSTCHFCTKCPRSRRWNTFARNAPLLHRSKRRALSALPRPCWREEEERKRECDQVTIEPPHETFATELVPNRVQVLHRYILCASLPASTPSGGHGLQRDMFGTTPDVAKRRGDAPQRKIRPERYDRDARSNSQHHKRRVIHRV
jgi:hypothetical protein